MIDPKTPQEWQDAADQAAFYLALDSARQFGLITTDIEVDVYRCEEILRGARAWGIKPGPLPEICKRMLRGRAA